LELDCLNDTDSSIRLLLTLIAKSLLLCYIRRYLVFKDQRWEDEILPKLNRTSLSP